jgi:hypothetical protein
MRTIKTINTKNQSNLEVYETLQPLTGLIKKTRVLSSKLNLGLSFKQRKREEELKSKAGETMATRVMHEQHANLIKNKSRNVSEFCNHIIPFYYY